MIHFEWPWMLLLLPLPWLVTRMLPPARPQGAALFLPFADAVAGALASGSIDELAGRNGARGRQKAR